MTTVTWLHLSDLHARLDQLEIRKIKRVLDSLWEDISRLIHKGLRPDFIVFTGDITYHGRMAEYTWVSQHFFDRLLEITGLPKSRLFVVPGNHDIDWTEIEIEPLLVTGMREFLHNYDEYTKFLEPDRNRREAFRKFDPYAGFVNGYLGETPPFCDRNYYYARTIIVNGYEIAIGGLNSVWMSACVRDANGKPLDQGNLLIGLPQIDGVIEQIERCDLRIVLLHHPIEWLHDNERFRVEKLLDSECHFVLHGHWHRPGVKIQTSLARQAIYIPAGASYLDDNYPNSYNMTQVDLASKTVRVHLRRYFHEGPRGRPAWMKDIEATGEDLDGVISFHLVDKTSGNMSLPETGSVEKLDIREVDQYWRTRFEQDGISVHGIGELIIGRPSAPQKHRATPCSDKRQLSTAATLEPTTEESKVNTLGANRDRLLDLLTRKYDLEGLRVLCFRIDAPFDDLPGSILSGKGASLIEWAERHSQLQNLISKILKEFPGESL